MKPICLFACVLAWGCGGSSDTRPKIQATSSCDAYLACLDSLSSSNPAIAASLSQAKMQYAAGGACDASAGARQACDSACTDALDGLKTSGQSCLLVPPNDDASVSSDMAVSTHVDFSIGAVDASQGPDFATHLYVATTPHEIDIAATGSVLDEGAAVKLSNVLVLSPPRGFDASNHTQCKYEVWVQDLSCTVAPCGLVLITQPIPKPTGAMYCPFPNDSLTLLSNTSQGDIVTINGLVDLYPSTSTSPAGTVVQHEVILDTLTTNATAHALPTPIAIVDSGAFVPYLGAGWAQYEGTYVRLTASGGGPLTAHAETYGNTMYSPTGALFADDFKFLYAGDAGIYPADGAMYSAVGGVVTTGFGGVVEPISANDFTP